MYRVLFLWICFEFLVSKCRAALKCSCKQEIDGVIPVPYFLLLCRECADHGLMLFFSKEFLVHSDEMAGWLPFALDPFCDMGYGYWPG